VPHFAYIQTALGAYLLGSIPTGFLVAKAKGIDIREAGSGNIGATNAMRVLGKPAGIFVLLVDAGKGWFAVQVFSLWMANHFIPFMHYETLGHSRDIAAVIAGVSAILGHNYPCWLKFNGGKGIATSAGVYVALAPWQLLIALAVFSLVLLLTRYVSVSSISAALALAAAVWILPPYEDSLLLGIVTTALAALAIYKHKTNIQRLMAGTENRLGHKTINNSKNV
jgi:glycerol-3-phosphate acyltransferase PlsY